ncbi:MAG: cytidine deaminase [Fusobacteria bacterium]|nr:cytidine deaminase [Fusobacteriota bacterium]
MTDKELVELAIKAKENAYNPYSGFKVGAALLTEDGTLYTGCNIESVSFTPTICAERVAVSKAISEGHRKIVKIAIASDLESDFIYPCGVCRQVLCEFMPSEGHIIVSKPNGDYKIHTLKEVFPFGFSNYK